MLHNDILLLEILQPLTKEFPELAVVLRPVCKQWASWIPQYRGSKIQLLQCFARHALMEQLARHLPITLTQAEQDKIAYHVGLSGSLHCLSLLQTRNIDTCLAVFGAVTKDQVEILQEIGPEASILLFKIAVLRGSLRCVRYMVEHSWQPDLEVLQSGRPVEKTSPQQFGQAHVTILARLATADPNMSDIHVPFSQSSVGNLINYRKNGALEIYQQLTRVWSMSRRIINASLDIALVENNVPAIQWFLQKYPNEIRVERLGWYFSPYYVASLDNSQLRELYVKDTPFGPVLDMLCIAGKLSMIKVLVQRLQCKPTNTTFSRLLSSMLRLRPHVVSIRRHRSQIATLRFLLAEFGWSEQEKQHAYNTTRSLVKIRADIEACILAHTVLV